MKKILTKVMAAIMAVIFILPSSSVFAAPSTEWASKDYRNIQIMNRQGVPISKPIAQFAAKRVVNGEIVDAVTSYTGYDCNEEIPTLTCYVGDTVSFEDLSRDTNPGGEIMEWDWQYFGTLGTSTRKYRNDVVSETSIVMNDVGVNTFFLNVRSNQKVKSGCCDPWSENGNHQTVGINRWYPKGGYWYFTAIRVVVKPAREAIVHLRCWDTGTNAVFYQNDINVGKLVLDGDTINTFVNIVDWFGYKFVGWKLRLPDNTIQYEGTDRNVEVALASWLPEKYLDVEFNPIIDTGVEVRYWDTVANKIIETNTVSGKQVVGDEETSLTLKLIEPTGYKINDWKVRLPDDTIQYLGTEQPVTVAFNAYVPRKFLDVECEAISKTKLDIKYIDTETQKVLKSKTIPGSKKSANNSFVADAEIEGIPGYSVNNWRVKTPDGKVERTGKEDNVSVELTEKVPHKILEIDCIKIGGKGEGDEPDDNPDDDPPAPTVIVKPSGVCDGVIEWTETDSHRVLTGYSRTGRPQYKNCNHTFNYKTVLTAEVDVSPTTLKSGYGFEADVDCSVSTRLVSRDGGCSSWGSNRAATQTVSNPTKAVVYIPWDMTNRLGTQSKSILMDSNGTLKFRLPISNVSEAGARKIYTPVELAGTEEAPETHDFEIYVSGGGIDGAEFCQMISCTIIINGDMYSDDFSAHD